MGSPHPLAALVVAKALVGRRAEHEVTTRRPGRRRAATRVFLAEHYSPDLDEQRADAITRRLRAAAAERGEADVRFLGSAGLPGDDSFLSIFAAPSVEAVAGLVRHAGIAADRIVPALWQGGDR
jgi:hypothetical protein